MKKISEKLAKRKDQKAAADRSDPMADIVADDQQQAVIDSPAGVIQVSAYAGTGKTTTLALRQRQMVDEGRAKTKRFLALTHTVAGKQQLESRLGDRTAIMTIHGYAYQLVKMDRVRKSRKDMPRILDDQQGWMALVAEAARKEARKLKSGSRRRETLLDIQDHPASQRTALAFLEMLGATGCSPRALVDGKDRRWEAFRPYLPALKLLSHRLRKLKARYQVCTFDDLIGPAIKIIGRTPTLPYKHLMVDEFQDCTPGQARLIHALMPHMHSTVVVGDRHQEIYGFAGAKFVDLTEELPDAVELRLTRSRRLTDTNAALGTALVRQADRKAARVIGTQGRGRRPQLWAIAEAYDQALAVTDLVQDLIGEGVQPDEIAILGRTQAQCIEIERVLRAAKVESSPGFRRAKKAHSQLLEMSLGLAERLERIDLGTPAQAKMRLATRALGQELKQLLTEAVPPLGCSGYTQSKNVRLLKKALLPGQSLEARLIACNKVVVSQRGGRGALDTDAQDWLSRWEPLAAKYSTINELRHHLRRQQKKKPVVLSTIHSAKGAEWEHVIVLNVIDGSMPIHMSGTDADLHAERNLLYVACTRAKKRLYLMEAPARFGGKSNLVFGDRSPYLNDKATLDTLRIRKI